MRFAWAGGEEGRLCGWCSRRLGCGLLEFRCKLVALTSLGFVPVRPRVEEERERTQVQIRQRCNAVYNGTESQDSSREAFVQLLKASYVPAQVRLSCTSGAIRWTTNAALKMTPNQFKQRASSALIAHALYFWSTSPVSRVPRVVTVSKPSK